VGVGERGEVLGGGAVTKAWCGRGCLDAAPWHAGMAYALGWMRAALQLIEEEPVTSAPH
jgi:hypothetical protein